MYFYQKHKLVIGPKDEDQNELAEKMHTIANLAWGSFESDILDLSKTSKGKVLWKLSDHYETSSISFDIESKLRKAFDSLHKRKEDAQAIKEKLAIKHYEFIESNKNDNDFETSSDLYMQTTEDDDDMLDDESNILNKERFYFGKNAKDRFWSLYKSDRTFKDQSKEEIKDPRFAYLKTWNDLKMLPKAGMVIRSEKTTHLSYANFGLLQKNSMAVAESLKRYPLEIESLDFTGNGIRAQECIMLVGALEPHLGTLQYLNFSGNKIGTEGAKYLAEKMIKMKNLKTLNLDGNKLGDDAVNEILTSASLLLNLERLHLSKNYLGQKVKDSELVETFALILKNTGTLVEVDLSWNNFRGEAAEGIILAFKENYTVKKLNLSNNLFGITPQVGQAAVIKFAEILHENVVLEEIDLSNNLIDAKSAFCLSHGLRTNASLKSFTINGNPIGSSGIKYLLQSINDNQNGKMKQLKMKETDTIVQSKKHQLFDPMNVEKEYELYLNDIYDRVILYHLLDIDEKISQNAPEEEELHQGDWFIDAKLAGSSWTSPKTKDKDGQWNLGPEPKDKMTFRFSLDPKRNQKPGPKDSQLPSGTIIDSKSLIKPLISDAILEKNIDMMIRLLIEDNPSCQRELVETMCQEYTFTFSQACEILKAIEDESKIYAWVRIFNRILDRHLRYDLLQLLPNIDSKLIAKKHLGEAYNFTFFNPTGHYRLKLSNKPEREVALSLLMFNRKYKLLVSQGLATDRSKMGNQSCFRNEKVSGVPFIYSEDFILPQHGVLECDFIYLWSLPHASEQTSLDKQDMVKDLLLSLEGNVTAQINAFRAFSEYMVMNSEQLGEFVELIDDATWKVESYIAGIGRIIDSRNYDFIKKKWKFPEASKEIYNRFGIFNLFNPFKWTGSYRLDLEIYEERQVWKILLELTKAEGYQYMTNVILDGKPIPEVNKEFVDSLPPKGIFEGSYVTPEEAADQDARDKIFKKYFGL